ncbi:hypothetical protein ACFW6K_05730 [Streptomyces sp. NPDC058733]|uniref:hypothetical protein n=1 Tax=Streptomyces sp. NPDC058733 TaxID=3346614 RepID=UPI0036A5E983
MTPKSGSSLIALIKALTSAGLSLTLPSSGQHPVDKRLDVFLGELLNDFVAKVQTGRTKDIFRREAVAFSTPRVALLSQVSRSSSTVSLLGTTNEPVAVS